jgi:hypothetical protein
LVRDRVLSLGWLRMQATGGYFENMWLWVADHIFDTGQSVNVSSPRGMLIQSGSAVHMYGVASEHSADYQYHLRNISMAIEILD